jgi:two-component system chemotaxis sensor kinase CheA
LTAIRQRLLEVFEIEYQEHLEAIRAILSKLDGAGETIARGDLVEATRRAHSLKGAARAVGLEDVESSAHALEALFISVERGEAGLDRDVSRHILDALDEIEDRVVASQASASPPPARRHEGRAEVGTRANADEADASLSGGSGRTRPSSVRIEASTLDQLLRSAGELHSDMLFQRSGSQDIRAIAGRMASLEGQWLAVWKRLALGLGQDLQRSGGRRLLEGGNQIGSQIKALARHLRTVADSQEQCSRHLRRHLDDLEGRVKAARMVPAESVFGGFRKMVRDVAASQGKQVEVAIEGLDCEADRLVLQRIKDPVMHMLRNAVSHGIESPAERRAKGKDPAGHVSLRVAAERDRLSIVVEDDGRGIEFRSIAEKAVSEGLLSRAEADTASDEALSQFLFAPGFSTANAVTKISGRGVGLSVAREAVTGLQGTLSLRSVPGRGARIDALLPISILSRRLLLVSFGSQRYALPTDSVIKVLRPRVGDVVTVEGRPALHLDGAMLSLVSIGNVLQAGETIVITDKEKVCIVVLRSGNARVGVVVEELIGVNEFVVRSLDIGGAQSPWSGIISTEDGSPCLVLNADVFSNGEVPRATAIVFKARQRQASASKVVLVVDDSITTRTLEKSILEANGYKVRLSVDGRDAIAQLRAEPADIVVSDIEMPHLNGFELVRSMKEDRTLADIPVVLVTSRADAADRERGLKLGADAYVVKQRFDQNDLLHTIKQLV